MTAKMKNSPRLEGNLVTDMEPVQRLSPQSSFSHRPHISGRLPSIAGIGLGIQNVRLTSRFLTNKTNQGFPSSIRSERTGKTVVSKGIQVSGEDGLSGSKLIALEKEILIKASLEEKDATILKLNKDFQYRTAQCTKDFEREVKSHEATRQKLDSVQCLLEEKEQLFKDSIIHYGKMTQDLTNQFEARVTLLKEQNQQEIDIRDEKISKLKQQISELFKEKSWEHQQQMVEWQKEVTQLSDEAQLLRIQLRKESTSKKECEQCKSLISALEERNLQLKLKNRTIEELQSICQRFEKQLRDQEKLQNLLVAKNRRNIK